MTIFVEILLWLVGITMHYPCEEKLDMTFYNPLKIFWLVWDWSKHVAWLNIPQVHEWYSPIFKTEHVINEKYLKDNRHNHLHWGRKYAQMLVPGHNPFLEAHNFPKATLSKNCLLFRTDNIHRQTSKHISVPNGGYLTIRPIAWKGLALSIAHEAMLNGLLTHGPWTRRV